MYFTVLLLYPDYLSDGTQTYQAHIEADNSREAAVSAQVDAKLDLGNPDDELDDFLVLAVYHGHLNDVKPNL